uniref:Uncharacterized protein n=1 Tax=Meleagris gallopavo TaxID=9103 RepID=A0A803YHU4_MELGA
MTVTKVKYNLTLHLNQTEDVGVSRSLGKPGPLKLLSWEKMEETFVASSTGEGMELINMVQQEDSQRMNSAVKNLLIKVMDDGNLNIYLCFMITY